MDRSFFRLKGVSIGPARTRTGSIPIPGYVAALNARSVIRLPALGLVLTLVWSRSHGSRRTDNCRITPVMNEANPS